MSNPAVVKLQDKKINGQSISLEDNFGEAIHIHIDNFRFDLTVKEFRQMCSDICDAVNAYADVEGFDCHRINAVYMERLLWEDMPRLCGVKMEQVALKEMMCPSPEGELKKLPESGIVKAMDGDESDADRCRDSFYNGQSRRERLDTLLESIREHGYPYDGEYIIMYGDDNKILDGQHRAACLWKLYGDVEVPVMRLYFKDYASPQMTVPGWKKNGVYQGMRKLYGLAKNPRLLYQEIRIKRRAMRAKKKKEQMERYVAQNQETVRSIEAVLDSK